MSSRPIVYLTRHEHFSAAHRLNSNQLSEQENKELYGKCNSFHGHGHNYNLEVTLKGPVDPVTGMVMNLATLKEILKEVLRIVDHKNLDKDIPHFLDVPSTTENTTIFLWDEIISRLPNPSLLHEVTVHETDRNVFKYRGELDLQTK